MTQEEIIQSISDDKMMPFIQPEQLVQIVAFVINNYRPSLPSNIDEAAEEYCTKCRENGYHLSPYSAFKVGAKWMAEQGETQEHFVIGTIADSPCGPAIVCYTNEFEIGDKVIIQIRKKD